MTSFFLSFLVKKDNDFIEYYLWRARGVLGITGHQLRFRSPH